MPIIAENARCGAGQGPLRAGLTALRAPAARWHRSSSTASSLVRSALLCLLVSMIAGGAEAQSPTAAESSGTMTAPPRCLPAGNGYLRARLTGALQTELAWGNEDIDCTGAMRPTDGGIRVRFAGAAPGDQERLVLVFGIAGLREGQSGKTLPVNLTVIREGTGQFYSTRGDDKCMLDKVTQEPLVGIPHRTRSYRVVARGFCTEPARAVRGEGVILISRFDFAGRIDFDNEDNSVEPEIATARR